MVGVMSVALQSDTLKDLFNVNSTCYKTTDECGIPLRNQSMEKKNEPGEQFVQ